MSTDCSALLSPGSSGLPACRGGGPFLWLVWGTSRQQGAQRLDKGWAGTRTFRGQPLRGKPSLERRGNRGWGWGVG